MKKMAPLDLNQHTPHHLPSLRPAQTQNRQLVAVLQLGGLLGSGIRVLIVTVLCCLVKRFCTGI